MKNKKAFTLIEVLIASSIFVMVSALGASIFINISSSERKTALMNGIYEDARVITEIIAREIRNSAIDYEEYYNINVIGSSEYGVNRGCYASRFYDPGFVYNGGTPEEGTNPENLGLEMIGEVGAQTSFPLSVDRNIGKNPWNGLNSAANAVCTLQDITAGCSNKQEELYLISADGREKTIIKKQLIGQGEFAISEIKMIGLDSDNNGTIDIFTCQQGYENCETINQEEYSQYPEISSITIPSKTDADTPFDPNISSFVPISPLRSNIKDLKFFIYPLEDPYKAFAEDDVQYQPYITIVMTLTPSSKEISNYSGTVPEVTIQTTISTGVRNKISTYPPTQDLSWIKDKIPPDQIP